MTVTAAAANGLSAPDFIEPVVGWRIWHAIDHGSGTQLSSVVHRAIWPCGLPLVATCRRFHLRVWPFRHDRHDAPALDCSCGIYAAGVATIRAYLPEELGGARLVPVIGQVALWGEVHEYERGWRAAYAYPTSLYVPVGEFGSVRAAGVISDLSKYGVPIHAVGGSSADALIEEATAAS